MTPRMTIAFIFFIISLPFSKRNRGKMSYSVNLMEETEEDAIDIKIRSELSSNLLDKILYLCNYFEEQVQLIIEQDKICDQTIQYLKYENDLHQSKTTILEQEVSSLNIQLSESRTLIREVRTRNTQLAQKTEQFSQQIKLLESHKKALIQELGGAIGKEDLEYATWDLVLQTTKLLIEERDKAIAENKLLHEKNQLLTQNINNLELKISRLSTQNNNSSFSQSEIFHLKSSVQIRGASLELYQWLGATARIATRSNNVRTCN